MKITVTERTSSRLVLRLTPAHTAAYWGFGLLFIALGVWAAWMLRHENPLAGLFLGVVTAAGGVVCILALESTLVVLDRGANAVKVRNVRWGRHQSRDMPLDRLEGVRRSEFRVRQASSWYVHLAQRGGHPLPLAQGPMFTAAGSLRIAELIEQWLEQGEGA